MGTSWQTRWQVAVSGEGEAELPPAAGNSSCAIPQITLPASFFRQALFYPAPRLRFVLGPQQTIKTSRLLALSVSHQAGAPGEEQGERVLQY